MQATAIGDCNFKENKLALLGKSANMKGDCYGI